MKRIATALLMGVMGAGFLLATASPAHAHGEEAQEAWLRMNTVAWWNVQFSTDSVRQGEEFTIKGTAKILETWPQKLGEPRTAFINVVAPGPVVLVKNRVVNGRQAPHSIYVERGGVYNFELTLVGRRTGSYHIHPTLAVKGAGTLIGPGQQIRVDKSPAGFRNDLTLYNGKSVNLENYGVWWPVFGFTFLGFLLGMVWLLYWIWPKRTVTRLAVTSQLSVNDDGGPAVGLITKRDHRAMNLILLATVALLAVGWIYQSSAYPKKIPQQVDRFRVQSAVMPASFAKADATDVTFDDRADTYVIKLAVTNTGSSPVDVRALHIANLTLLPAGTLQTGAVVLSPTAPVAAGQTQTFTLQLPVDQLRHAQLIPEGNANTNVAAVVELRNGDGVANFDTVQQFMKTRFA